MARGGGDRVCNGWMTVKGVAFQDTDKSKGGAFDKTKTEKCGSGINRTAGMKAAGTDVMGSKGSGYGCFVVIQQGYTPLDHFLLRRRLRVIRENKKQNSGKQCKE